MDKKRINIQDDEFRIIGGHGSRVPKKKNRLRRLAVLAFAAAILAALAGCLFVFLRPPDVDFPLPAPRPVPHPYNDFFDPAPDTVGLKKEAFRPLGMTVDSLRPAFTEKRDTVINDVLLSVYIPHNAPAPVLWLGAPDTGNEKAILALQAADIRKDNRQILGAFVLKGRPLAWGLSKKGYCAIIDGKMTIGVSDNSPLFEEATEKGGYFFRQYPLVDNGVPVENEPKNKTMRKALCDRGGQILVVVSESDESFHDFAQALADLGVDQAIYLVGSHSSFGWYRNEAGEQIYFGTGARNRSYKNENYIVWSQR